MVRGNTTVAMTRGAYDYIKASGLGMVTRSGARFDADKAWPDAALVRVETPYRIRHYFNVVTFGYQTPYYTQATWTRELDWLALHGFDMAMAPVATEAIAERAWKRLGLTQAELNDFSCGPAHLPWFRMGNIRQVDAPLPPAWHKDQLALQHFLLDRMRELGITPVIQSFAGFVPDAVKRLDPKVELHDTSWHGGFGRDRRPRNILPDTALFARMTRLYMEEYQREFGRQTYWLVDSFNEMELPRTGKSKEEMLAGYGLDTYKAITAGNPDAVWVIQGWMFGYQQHIWSREAVAALLSKVPDDRMLVLDYANDYADVWGRHEAFHGKQWLYGFVPNMGGKIPYTGRLELYATGAASALASPARRNLAGFTVEGEGMENNELIYELLSDVPWARDGAAVDLDRWLAAYATAKFGACPPEVTEAWSLLRHGPYGTLVDHPYCGWQRAQFGGSWTAAGPFGEAARKFLAAAPALRTSPLYRADALEFAALALGLRADEWFKLAREAASEGDTATGDKAFARGAQLLADADRLLESHPIHRLARWTELARAHGDTAALKDYYESNAKRILTTWGPPVNDYAGRVWSGLIRDYYLPRMKGLYQGMRSGDGFNAAPWEEKWIKTPGVSAVAPFPDPVAKAAELVDVAYAEKLPAVAAPKSVSLGDWSPAIVGTTWKTVEFAVPADQLKALRGVRFSYTSGRHALEIQRVALVADGREVAVDAHAGLAGTPSNRNAFQLRLPAGATANNGCVIRASVRGKDGNDTRGAVQLLVE